MHRFSRWARVASYLPVVLLLSVATPAVSAQTALIIDSVIVYQGLPMADDFRRLDAAQLRYQVLAHLPMALVRGTSEEVRAAASGPNVRTVRSNAPLELYLDESVPVIGANRVWTELGFTGRGVGVAVLDSGLNARHDDLPLGSKVTQNVQIRISSAQTAGSARLLVVAEDVADSDVSGHGTHVASAIAGTGLASYGRYAGVAKDANLIGIGSDGALSTFWALGALDWVLEHRERYNIRVINNSWGVGGPFDPDAPINVATRALYEAGITVVFAAGNSGPEPNTLNALSVAPWVISVAAGKNDRSLVDFSSRGVKGDPLYHPTITAPGVQVMGARDPSSFIGLVVGTAPTDRYMAISGTSLAAPHVAGVAALMQEANDRLSPDDIKAILVGSATPMMGHEEYEVGAGFLDAYEAVRRASR